MIGLSCSTVRNCLLFWMVFPPVVALSATVLCNRMPGLTPKQRTICLAQPDAMVLVGEADKMALAECRHQFRLQRWNCTNIDGTDSVLGVPPALSTRETGFVYAIRSAAVTYAITVACSQANLVGCGCDPTKRDMNAVSQRQIISGGLQKCGGGNANTGTACGGTDSRPTSATSGSLTAAAVAERWKWGGCSAHVQYGAHFSKIFVDAKEMGRDSRTLLNKHNNAVGRKVVQQSLTTQCRCNGVSGSCTLKTCWSSLPPFRAIGERIYARYVNRSRRVQPVVDQRSATPVYLRLCRRRQNQQQVQGQIVKDKRPRSSDIVYTELSPSYCDYDAISGTPGTSGRHCDVAGNRSNGSSSAVSAVGSCEHLCCGRGFTTNRYSRVLKCNCKFHWCCRVTCKTCQEKINIGTCNPGPSSRTTFTTIFAAASKNHQAAHSTCS